MVSLTELEYHADSAARFEYLRHLPYAVYLDSGHGSSFAGRYDILAAEPYLTLTTRGELTEIRRGRRIEVLRSDPLALIADELGPRAPSHGELPFTGGAIGYFGYDLGRRFERVDGSAVGDVDMPDMLIGIYDWAVVVDHATRRAWLASSGRDPATAEQWPDLIELVEGRAGARHMAAPFEVLTPITSNLDARAYADAFTIVTDHIRRGDCYQINLTQRFEAGVRGDSWQAYRALRAASPAPFSAYLKCADGEILSSSPERFLRVIDGRVETKPIKGTRPRSADRAADSALASELAASVKDRAENVMIVDLLRNDLGKTCEPGSVRAEKLFEVESFANVHHLVSTVTGTLRSDSSALDLLRGAFPGGSITGAPKLAAMQIIDELEPHRRGVYCGSVGYIGFDGRMDTNIAIRTLVRSGDSIYAWAGGGIVADSELEAEYQESFDKASALLAVLGEGDKREKGVREKGVRSLFVRKGI